MKISDYIFGRRLSIRSTLPKEELEVRINQAAGSNFWPFRGGVVGGVYIGRLRLRYQGFPLLDYNAKPRLSGNLNSELGVTSAELSYRAPTWVLAFFSFWYLFLTAISLFVVVAYLGDDSGLNREALPMFAFISSTLWMFPIGLHLFGTRNSDEELEMMLDFLREEAGASVE